MNRDKMGTEGEFPSISGNTGNSKERPDQGENVSVLIKPNMIK